MAGKRRREPAYLVAALYLGFIVLALWTENDVLLALAVVMIGVGGLASAAYGKPEWDSGLMQLLPAPWWRAVAAAMGLGTTVFGVWGLIASLT